jgi:DNA-binding MarR family transcriptional regulator
MATSRPLVGDDPYAEDRRKARYARAGSILRLAAYQAARRVLDYALDHPSFELTRIASHLGLTVAKLYPSMGRMIKLGMIAKRYAAHRVVVYDLTYEGRLVAACLRQLVDESSTRRETRFDDGYAEPQR